MHYTKIHRFVHTLHAKTEMLNVHFAYIQHMNIHDPQTRALSTQGSFHAQMYKDISAVVEWSNGSR